MSEPLVFACWKWTAPAGYRSTFTAEHVNVLARMIGRHYAKPHKVLCITDDAEGIDQSIGVLPLWSDHADLMSPHGPRNPSCYRRLKMFSAEAADFIGLRFVSIDLDSVIVDDISPLFDRPEEIVLWGDTHPTTHFNGGLILMTAGARRQVWDSFDPVKSPMEARRLGQWGSDQGWIGACLGPNEAKWTRNDGVYSYRNHIEPSIGRGGSGGALPKGARLVSFHGAQDPWSEGPQRLDWVRRFYR